MVLSEKNITKAAERLKLSQPTVSRQLKALESELSARLFLRDPRDIRPTLQGQLFFDYAQKILNLADKARISIQSLPFQLEGSFRIATVNYLGMSLITPALWNFLNSGSKLKIKLFYASAREIIEMMKKNEIDSALLPSLKNEYGVALPQFESHFLFKDPIILTSSRRKNTSLPQQINFSDIGKHSIVSFGNLFPQFNMYLEKNQKSHNILINPSLEVNNLGALKKIIESGFYWGFMPASSIRKQLKTGRLSQIKVSEIDYSMNIELYSSKTLKNKKTVEILVEILKKYSLFQS